MGRRGAGEGTVFYDEAKGLWVGAVDFGLVDGKRRRVVRKAKTRQALMVKMRDLQRTRDGGQLAADLRGSTAAWLAHWTDNVLPLRGLAPNTVSSYRNVIKNYINPHVGRVPLARLDVAEVEAMMAELFRRGLSPGTVRLARRVLGMALAHAEVHGRVARNAAARSRGPRGTRGAKMSDRLTAAEANDVIATATGDRLGALATLVLTTGLRQGEALALRWDDLDLDHATLTVRRTTTKTLAGVRMIGLAPVAVDALRAHRRLQMEERMAAPFWSDPGLVFAQPTGTPISASYCLKWWYDLTIAAGIGRRRFHASRHTAATLMLNNGVPLEVVSKTLGHAGLAITADVYAEVLPELQRGAADAMQNVLGARAAESD